MHPFFFRYAAATNPENIILQAGLDKIPRQKQEKFSGVDYMSEAAVKTLLEQPDTRTRRGIRDQFFMILMYDSAARIQEMLDLRVCDIRLGNTPTAILKGKGSKIRSVPLMPETINHFQNYMKLFHPDGHMHSQQPLFMWNNAAQGIPCQMTMSGNFSGVMEHQQGKTVLKFRKMCIRIFGGHYGSEVKWGVLKNPIFSYVSDKITPHFTLVVINH